MPEFQGPLFIVGMPRSGTKLLRGIVNRHERVAIPDAETEFLPFWVAKWPAFGDLSDRRRFGQFYRRCRNLPFFVYRNAANQSVDCESWYGNCREFTPAGVFEALMRTCLALGDRDGTIWGDKSPSYLTHLPLLRELYPRAKFVHIIRDVRDYCLSMNKAWGKSIFRAAQRWSDDVASCRTDGAGLGNHYLEIRYEDLLAASAQTVGRVCDFIGIPYRAALLEIPASVEAVGDARGKAGILRSNVRKFESRLDARTRSRLEAIAGETLRAAGYDCAYTGKTQRIGPLTLRCMQAMDGLHLLAAEARQRGVFGGSRFLLRYFLISGNR
jgi:hypothetical protein